MSFSQQKGYSLLELVATLSVLAILVMGAIPLAQNAARREKETRLRETLRDVRRAIDEFKRDSLGACPQGAVSSGNRTLPGGNIPVDPRSRVVIDDCTIFTTDNIDRFPPSLQVLVDGVKVRPRGADVRGGRGLGDDDEQATDINLNKERKKVYLRELPVDPMTGKTEWKLRSSYQDKDADTWDSINVFDIRSASDQEALNGDKYSDW